MDVKIIDVLRLAYTFKCLDCDTHLNCGNKKRNVLERVIGRLQEMAVHNAPDGEELNRLIKELHEQKHCNSSIEPVSVH